MRFNNYDEKNQCPFCDHFNLGFFIHFEMFLSRLVNPVQNYWWPFSSVFQARNCEWCCFNLSYRFSIFSFYLLLAQVWICFASDQANDTTSSSNCCSQPEISRLNSQLAFTSDFPETLVVLLVLINYSQTYIFYTYILGLPSFIRPVNGEWLWWWTYISFHPDLGKTENNNLPVFFWSLQVQIEIWKFDTEKCRLVWGPSSACVHIYHVI